MEEERSLKFSDRIFLRNREARIMFASRGSESHSGYYVRMPDEGYMDHPLMYPCPLDMMFEVHPQLNYEAHNEYIDLAPADPNKKTAQRRMILEENLNKTKLAENNGKPVYIDSTIQLYHVATETYIQFNPQKIADSEMGVVGSTKITSENCQFRISLPFGFYKKGTPLTYDNSFVLQDSSKRTLAYPLSDKKWEKHIIKPCAVTSSRGVFEALMGRENTRVVIDEPLPFLIENQLYFKGYLAGYVNIAEICESFGNSFQAVKASCYFKQSEGLVLWGNNISIRKMDNSMSKLSNLISECNVSSIGNKVKYRFYEKNDSKRLISIESHFQIVPLHFKDLGKPIVYNKKKSVPCLLKNLLTGKFLKEGPNKDLIEIDNLTSEMKSLILKKDTYMQEFDEKKKKIDSGNYDLDEYHELDIELFKTKSKSYLSTPTFFFKLFMQHLTFRLVKMSSDNDHTMNNSNFFKIVTPTGNNLVLNEEKIVSTVAKQEKDDLFYNNFENVMQRTYTEDHKMITSSTQNEYDLFYFQEVGRSMETILTRITSLLQSLIRAPQADMIDTMFLMEYNEAITRLILLFNSIVMSRELDKLEVQNLFRQASVIDMIMRFLTQVQQSKTLDTGILSNTFDACDKSINLLDYLVKNHTINSLYVFQWKNLITSSILDNPNELLTRTNLDNVFFAIIDILQYNWVYTQDFIEPLCSRIRFKNYDCHKIEILIKILNSFRNCSAEKSMDLIYRNIFKTQNQAEIFKKFKLEDDGAVVVVVEPIKNEIEICRLLEDDTEKLNYLIMIMKLGAVIAELDLLKVSNKLSEIFPKDACMKLIENESLSNEFRCLVLNIYSSIYILNPVYHYKAIRFSDKVIIPDELDFSPSPKKKTSNIFTDGLLKLPEGDKGVKNGVQRAMQRADLGEIITNVDNKNYLSKFMQEGENNKAILYSSLKITMQLLETNFFTKAEIMDLKDRIESIVGNDHDSLLELQTNSLNKSKNFISMKTFMNKGGRSTLDIGVKALESKHLAEESKIMDNYSDNSIATCGEDDTHLGIKTEKYDYIILLLNLLLKINEIIISLELRDSLVNKKSLTKPKKDHKHSSENDPAKSPTFPTTKGFNRRRNRSQSTKLLGTRIDGVGTLHLSTNTHEINSDKLTALFTELRFRNNEKLSKVVLSYFSLGIPQVFFKVLEFYQKVCRQKYFLFKMLQDHYLIQDDFEKSTYDVYKKSCNIILKAVRNISRNYNIETSQGSKLDLGNVVEAFRERFESMFVQSTPEGRVRQMEFNMREQFSSSSEFNQKAHLSSKEHGILCNLLNLFYMKLDNIVVTQIVIWKSGFLSLLIEILSFFNSRLFGKDKSFTLYSHGIDPLFYEDLFKRDNREYCELNMTVLLMIYYSVYQNSDVASYLINNEGEKFLNLLLAYLQSPEMLLKKVSLMLLTLIFGCNFDTIYSLNKRFRQFFINVIEEFKRESKAVNYEILTNYLEFFKRMTSYSNLVFEKNYDMVHEAIAGLQSFKGLGQTTMITAMMNTEVKSEMNAYFKEGNLKKIARSLDFKKLKQDARARSKGQNRRPQPQLSVTGGITPEMEGNGSVPKKGSTLIMSTGSDLLDDIDENDSTFCIARIPAIIVYINELMKYFAHLGYLGSNDLKLKIRNIVSIDSILGVFSSAKEFWFFKITILKFLNTIFINQKLDLKAKGQIFQFVKDLVMPDIREYSENIGDAQYMTQIFLKSDFTQINGLFLKKEQELRVCYNFYCYDYLDSQSYYVKESIMYFMKSYVTVCQQDNNSGVIDSLIDLIDDQKNQKPENVLQTAHQIMTGRHIPSVTDSQRNIGIGVSDKRKPHYFAPSFKDAIDIKKAELLSKLGRLFESEIPQTTIFEQNLEAEDTDLFLIKQFLRYENETFEQNTMSNVKKQYMEEFSEFNAMLKIELEKTWKQDENCYVDFLKQCCMLLSNTRCDSKVIMLLLKYFDEQFQLQLEKEKLNFIEWLVEYHFVPNFFAMIYQREKDKSVVFKALNFLKELLGNGSTNLQNSIYEELSREADNKFSNIVLRYWDEGITNFNELEGLKFQLFNNNSKVKYHRDILEHKLDQKCVKQVEGITTILEVLRLMCEDHFMKLQNYLRVQTMGNNLLKPAQVNFLEKVILFFKHYIKVAKEDNEVIGTNILRFLIELVQGPCKENQVETIKKKLLEPLEDLHCNLIYSTYTLSRETRIELINLILTLKLGIIESTKDKYIVKTLSISLNLDLVWFRITAIYCDLNNIRIRLSHSDQTDSLHRTSLETSGFMNKEVMNNLLGVGEENSEASTKTAKLDKHSSYSINMVEALNSMILISQLSICGEDISANIESSFSRLADHFKIISKARRFFMDKIRSIEYVDADQSLQTLFFYIHPKTNFLSHFTMLKFEEQVDRRNWTSKASDMIRFIPKAYLEIKHNYAMFSRLGIHISVSYFYIFKIVNFIIAVVVNLMFLVYPHFPNETDDDRVFQGWSKETAVEKGAQILCFIMIINYSLAFCLYIVYEFVVKLEIFALDQNKMESEHLILHGTSIRNESYYRLRKIGRIAYKTLFHTKVLQISSLLICCILGLLRSKMYFAFILLDIIDISPVLMNVIKSVTINFAALSTTWLFIMIAVFIYSSVAYFNKPIKENMELLDQQEIDVCGNFAICFWNMMLYGIKAGGGIGEVLAVPDYRRNPTDYAYRTLFDMIFWIVMILILMNIILGIIIDSFAELRDIRNQISRHDLTSARHLDSVFYMRHHEAGVQQQRRVVRQTPGKRAQHLELRVLYRRATRERSERVHRHRIVHRHEICQL